MVMQKGYKQNNRKIIKVSVKDYINSVTYHKIMHGKRICINTLNKDSKAQTSDKVVPCNT